jgi:putative hydrolase of the HAD superfamily
MWDFDRTLARGWLLSEVTVAILDEELPGHGVAIEDLSAQLRSGFPWHKPEQPHPEIADPGAWWGSIEKLLSDTLVVSGIEPAEAAPLAAAIHLRFLDPAGFLPYPDIREALELLSSEGWAHAVVSNHVPELPDLVAAIGLGDHFDAVFSSARTGYEKPHPEMFRLALAHFGEPERAYMVGDDLVTDVQGAEAVGIVGLHLVRTEPLPRGAFRDALQIAEVLTDAERSDREIS